jgi:hypothetical protein
MMELTDDDLASVDAAICVLEKIKTIRQRRERDWLDAWTEGELITTDEAANVANCSAETIRRRADEAADVGHPIGMQLATVWIISLPRLLRDIERRQGRPARLEAATRAKKIAEMRASPQMIKNINARCGDVHTG